jgi:hypothetical protein
MSDTDITQVQKKSAPNPESVAGEIQRLQQSYAARVADERPLSHSVAVAFQQVIAARERDNR